MKKKWMIMISVFLLVVLCLVVFFWPYITAARQLSHTDEILADCSYEVTCHVSKMETDGESESALKLLSYMGISMDSVRIAGEKQGELIHMNCYLPEESEAVLEAYGNTEDIMLNIRPIYEYLRIHGKLSGLMHSILPEMTDEGFVSLSRFTGEAKRGIEISDDILSRLDQTSVLKLRKCSMPENSAFSSGLENMYFFRLEGEQGSCILGIDKQVKKERLNCYISISSEQLEAEGLIACRQEELALAMPQESFSSWQLQFIEWIGQLLRN